MREDVAESEARAGTPHRRRRLLPTLALLAGAACWAASAWRATRLEALALAGISDDLERGLNARAARKLNDVLASHPASGEANYLLGVAERARGRTAQAMRAWARVPPGSPFAPRAIQGRVELEIERGRLAEAERIVLEARRDPRIEGSGLGLYLGPIYSLQGRADEARRFVEDRWESLDRAGEGGSEEAIHLARLSDELREREVPAETIRSFLDQAGAAAPDDDRVWLGRANLAIRQGDDREAERWLDACRRRRPDDLPVWRARLRRAVAADRFDEVPSALERIPAVKFPLAEAHRIAARLAAHRGDIPREAQALDRLIAEDPTDGPALDRLAELADRSEQPRRAAEIRRRKAEMGRIRDRYQQLLGRNQPLRDAEELARLAQQLGRRFEAGVFLAVAAAVDPAREDLRRERARLRQQAQKAGRDNRTLADLLAVEPAR